MIYVTRTAEPEYLKKREAKWIVELRKARREKNVAEFKRLQGRYGHAQIKKALTDMFSGKCAYCESVIGVVATGHIEHFRPKARFISLTYRWTNLLLGCPKCNEGEHKGNKFPNRLNGGPFLDPSKDQIDLHLDFIYDSPSGLALVKAKSLQGQLMIETFGLNSRPELLRVRTLIIKTLLAIKPEEGTNAEFAEILKESRLASSPYQAWVKKYNL